MPHDPTPLLVVGRNRSGTKWLSNLLIQSDDIFGVAWPAPSSGILETNVLGWSSESFPSLERPDDLIGYLCLWCETDFVRRSGLSRDEAFELLCAARPTDPIDALRALMTEAARRAGARYWLIKSDPTSLEAHHRRFADARWIVTRRGPTASLLSLLHIKAQPATLVNTARQGFAHGVDDATMLRLGRRHDALHIRYEDLRADVRTTMARIADALGIELHDAMLRSPYPPNTSFAAERPTLSLAMATLTRAAYAAGRLLPRLLARSINRSRVRGRRLVGNTYHELKRAHFPRS